LARWWYTPVLPGEDKFPESCRQTFVAFVRRFSAHLARKRAADPFLDFLANSASIIIVFLNELGSALQTSQRQSPEEAVQAYLDDQPESNLANVLSRQQQERKLSLVADDILQNFLDPTLYSCPPVKIFLQEVLSGLVLETTIKDCSKPEWINGWIVYLLEGEEPELMNVIDAGVEGTINASNDASTRDTGGAQGHRRRVSRAEVAMQEAMLEAKRLSEMIAEDDARKQREVTTMENEDALSSTTTEPGMATPTSSDSDRTRHGDMAAESAKGLEQYENASPRRSATSINPATSNETARSLSSQTTLAQPSSYTPTPLGDPPAALLLTLHNASITLLDDSDPRDKSVLRQKPNGQYLLQIEPASSRFPGWMIPRKYAEFEALHESIRRIAIISGVPEFAQKYATLPGWKGQSPLHLRQDLEQYLQLAVRYESLAESEAMKKFLEKETGLQKVPANKNVLGFQNPAALEAVGKGFINVLGTGSKGIAGGGKAVLGGVQGVFGAVATGVGGPKKSAPGPVRSNKPSISVPSLPQADSHGPRPSQDVSRVGSLNVEGPPPLPTRPTKPGTALQGSPPASTGRLVQLEEALNLPPPPSDMPDDYDEVRQSPPRPDLPPRPSTSTPTTPTKGSTRAPSIQLAEQDAEPTTTSEAKGPPLTEEETRVSVELMFAIITELYSLSSAWTLRLSLLAAAKTFLLRPNNPQLESIRSLLQDSVINANFSDQGLATHINKLRESALPTDEERKKWPPELTPIEKEKLRVKARKLLVEKGMPQALTSVMGAQASGEALGRVFDCLQIEQVARGLVFAIMLQAIRAATQ
jgi:hypothetical protein